MKYFAIILFFLMACSPSEEEYDETNIYRDRIINGHTVDHFEFPSIVALVSTYNGMSFCTGTLIKKDLVITAAHCINSLSKTSTAIVYGANIPVEAKPSQAYSVYKNIKHPDFDELAPLEEDNDLDWNDIALIVLKEPIENAVCSPILMPADFNETLFINNVVTIAGYGHITLYNYDGGTLYAADTVIAGKYDYELLLGNAFTPNACHGDSGGPAYVTIGDTRYVTGITSRAFAKPYCETGAYYTIPGMYLDWIDKTYKETIKERDLNKTSITNSNDCPLKSSVKTNNKTIYPRGGCSISSTNNDNSFSILFLVGLLMMLDSRLKKKNIGR